MLICLLLNCRSWLRSLLLKYSIAWRTELCCMEFCLSFIKGTCVGCFIDCLKCNFLWVSELSNPQGLILVNWMTSNHNPFAIGESNWIEGAHKLKNCTKGHGFCIKGLKVFCCFLCRKGLHYWKSCKWRVRRGYIQSSIEQQSRAP
jgi:hypothetical protein